MSDFTTDDIEYWQCRTEDLTRANNNLKAERLKQKRHILLLQATDDSSTEVIVEMDAELAKLKERILHPCVTCDVYNENDKLKEEKSYLASMMQDIRNASDAQMQQSLLNLRCENAKLRKELQLLRIDVRDYINRT